MTKNKIATDKMPILFFGHGSPMNAIEKNEFTTSLDKLAESLPNPIAILMISAHWETQGTMVTGMSQPKTIHDFYGFPKELFNVEYTAPGDPRLAEYISASSSDPEIAIDRNQWGLDHGTWVILKHIFPKANIPVIQLSLNRNLSLKDHFELGKKLSFLRKQGVMIMGSGNIVHNIREINWEIHASPHDWAIEFDGWVKEKLINRAYEPLVFAARNSQSGKLSIPTLDHYLPLLYIVGASELSDSIYFFHEGFQNSSMSMRSFIFSSPVNTQT